MYSESHKFVGGNDNLTDIVQAASTASKEVQERTKEELSEIRNRYAKETDEIKHEFEVRADKERTHLAKKLEGRKKKRVDELTKQVRALPTRYSFLPYKMYLSNSKRRARWRRKPLRIWRATISWPS